MSHRNARATFQGRLLIVQRCRAGWPQAHLAKAMGISRKCVKKWPDRYAAEGEAGLRDRSSRPHRCPSRTSVQVERQIGELRQRQRRGPDWIGAELGIQARTVSRVLVRHQVPRLCTLDSITGQQLRGSKTTTIRYERQRPGELVHMDVKKLGRILDGGGWRARGRANRKSTKNRSVKIGLDYVHSLVDDHSRLAYSEVLPEEQGPTCAFLQRAAAYFAAHKWSLRAVCTDLGITQKFIKPHCAWQNGKAERFHRTLQTEWAYARPYTSETERRQALTHWLHLYNHHRHHTALGGHPPATRIPNLSGQYT